MDLYGDDRSLSELNEELNDFLDHDAFTPTTSSDSGCGLDTYAPTGMDEDWLDSFFEDPVLNDRMISDALQPPAIRHEHSYSLANATTGSDTAGDGALTLIKTEPMEQDLDADLLTCPTTSTSQLNLTFTPTMTLKQTAQTKQTTNHTHSKPDADQHTQNRRQEKHSLDCGTTTTFTATAQNTSSTNRTTPTSHVLKQPTIILATTTTTTQGALTSHHTTGSGGGTHVQKATTERLVLPKVNIKLEPQEQPHLSPEHNVPPWADALLASYHALDLPPTPPSSTNSDSEGSLSPTRSAPSSPIRQSALRHAVRTGQTATLFSAPISQSGVLMLSEEEKRTLVSEGYPIPQKLPLTKQEEKNLKKIRRKIKNKISAQESRRKKKEYLETLEKKVEVYNQENVDLKKKMESLENNNRSLLSQLQKLQSIVSKITKPANTTQNTCLMVFVLCFAVFLGSWSPANFSIGQSRAGGAPSAIKVPMGPVVKGAHVDAYATTNLRSRVLLSMKEDPDDDHYGPATPFSYREMLVSFFHGSGGLLEPPVKVPAPGPQPAPRPDTLDPKMPKVHITDAQSVRDANLHNETGDRKMSPSSTVQTPPHPDITADVPKPIDNTSL